MKKIIVTLLLAALVLAAVPALAQNAFTAANGGIVPTIQYVTYEGFGFVEVDFLQDVNYENPTVSVTDASGAPVTAAIVQLDDDDLTFQITDFAVVAPGASVCRSARISTKPKRPITMEGTLASRSIAVSYTHLVWIVWINRRLLWRRG